MFREKIDLIQSIPLWKRQLSSILQEVGGFKGQNRFFRLIRFIELFFDTSDELISRIDKTKMEKDDFNFRRISAPVGSNLPEENTTVFRSLRTEDRRKSRHSPEIYVIPESDNEVETRLERPKLHIRPISADSLRIIHYTKSDNTLHPPNLHANHAFGGSHNHIHRSTSTLHSSTSVVHEQYCSCFKHWTKREKILITIIAFLLFFVCGLITAVGVLIEKQGGNETNSMWFSFRL